MTDQYLSVGVIILFCFSLFYFYALKNKNNSVVDWFWGIGFIIAAISAIFISQNFAVPQILITGLVILWGSRLSFRIYTRNKDKPEDWRYASWRKDWGKDALIRSYTDVFLVQAVMCFLVALPVIFVNLNVLQIKYPLILIIGLAVWIFGFIFESLGDAQLDEFKKTHHKKGQVLDSGLWAYSRHPNYFGEATIWWGIAIIALSFSLGAWWTFLGPITITYLLLKVSGIPLIESKMMQNQKYKDYAKKTNKFVPRFSKS